MVEEALSEFDESVRATLDRMFSGCQEVIGAEHAASIVSGSPSHSGDGQIVAYIGLEPSGQAHLGWVILADTISNLLEEGANVIILLADWHAWVNDKFDRDMEKIGLAGEYMIEVFKALLGGPNEGEGPGELRFIRASEIMDSGKYWERVLRCSKNMSLSRVRRTFSIMGRDHDSSDHDLAAFYYPALQAADIFELDVDIAFGGMDQRKAHMYMREVADRNGWTKATCIHTPMLSGLRGSTGRMDSFDHKMSKSDPNNAILLHDTEELLRKKMKKAFLEVGNPSSPVFEIARNVVIPKIGQINVHPNPEYGEPTSWADAVSFEEAVSSGAVHPLDAKMAIASGLSQVLEPIKKHFAENDELLHAIVAISGGN
ncbi:MAG TPA: tyrosine--tRNA ligase [Candidatus Thalassarchaeaceae archaeon]|jgi:tyrosyl-tRNA synthetase|nr:tyrosine--tRNA ligase [Candidatus Thalassarchaeaceae archaeon]|tara:strand:- start:7542 stop:8657 length:1116 start_codon:yes stop_codon:yes gene_type:complete